MRKRHNANHPCNPDLDDDDEQFRIQAMGKVGCVPPYWKHLQVTPMTLRDCNSSFQMREMYDQIKHYKRLMGSYDPPCEEMNIFYNVQREAIPLYPAILFTHGNDMYEEIINEKYFPFEEFLSSMGGIIAVVFLGYSVLQIPELLSRILKRVEDNSRNRNQLWNNILNAKCFVAIWKWQKGSSSMPYMAREGDEESMQV